LHHLALTVTDLDASVRWYEAVFDVHPVLELPHDGGVGMILADPERRTASVRPFRPPSWQARRTSQQLRMTR